MCCYALWYRWRTFCNAPHLDLNVGEKLRKQTSIFWLLTGAWAPSAPLLAAPLTVLMCFLHSGFLIKLRLPWKTESALNSLYWIYIFAVTCGEVRGWGGTGSLGFPSPQHCKRWYLVSAVSSKPKSILALPKVFKAIWFWMWFVDLVCLLRLLGRFLMSQNPAVAHTFSLQVSPTGLVGHASDAISARYNCLPMS